MNLFRPLVFGAWLVAAAVSAADWPQWRGPDRTGHAANQAKLIQTFPAEPKTLWRLRAGEGLASPVVARGRVFIFDNQAGEETLRAVDAARGQELWRASVDVVFRDSQGPSGPRCTPVVDEDRAYVQSCRGELRCLNVVHGTTLWRVNFTRDFGATFIGEKGTAQGATRHGNNGSPAVDGDRLYVQVGSTRGAGVVCFDKTTGQVIWKSQSDLASYAAPMIATIAGTRQLVSFTADGVIGLKPNDGVLLWRFPVKTDFSRHAVTPLIKDDVIVVSSHQAGLIGIKVAARDSGQTAVQSWLNKQAAINFASPVAVGGYLYGLGPNKNVECVEVATGRVRWSKEGWWTTSADKAYGAFLVLGKNILVLTDGGTLILFAADPKECREVARAQVCGANWCNPAYADGQLFLRDGLRQRGEWKAVSLLR